MMLTIIEFYYITALIGDTKKLIQNKIKLS